MSVFNYYDNTHILRYVKTLDLNTVGDTAVSVPWARFNVVSMKLANASTSLAASSATVGMYDAPAAGGTAIVTPATATGLTTADKVDTRTIANNVLTSGTTVAGQRQLYVRVGVAHGSAATCSVLIEVTRWTS